MTVDEAWNDFSKQQRLGIHIPSAEIPFLRTVFEAGFKSGKINGMEYVVSRLGQLQEELSGAWR